jgi:hypothetical protein
MKLKTYKYMHTDWCEEFIKNVIEMDSDATIFLSNSWSSEEEKDLIPAGNRNLAIESVAHHRTELRSLMQSDDKNIV